MRTLFNVQSSPSFFGDGRVQTVLSATSERPISTNELSSSCEVLLQTIDRRTERMTSRIFVTKEYEINRDDSLRKMSEMIFNCMSICLIASGFKVDTETTDREVAPDQFTWMWEDIHGGE